MSVVSMIEAERDRYVAYFDRCAADAVAELPSTVRELLIAVNSDTLPYPYRYLRVDLLGKTLDGLDKAYELWLDPSPEVEARGFQLGPVQVEIYPFTWCAVQIAFDRPLPDLAQFEAILTRWLDIDNESTEPMNVAKAIHSATPVETNGQLWYLTIDFGSAPADYLLDLIDYLANECRADQIIIASPTRR